MKAPRKPHFDVAVLREQAGAKVFARGEEYHRDGQVDLLSVEQNRVLARVLGSEDYRTVLTRRGKKIGGECSCPAFRDWGFGKHMVATGLAANEVTDDGREEGPSVLDRIRAHLKRKGVDALVEMVVELAERDGLVPQARYCCHSVVHRRRQASRKAAASGNRRGYTHGRLRRLRGN